MSIYHAYAGIGASFASTLLLHFYLGIPYWTVEHGGVALASIGGLLMGYYIGEYRTQTDASGTYAWENDE